MTKTISTEAFRFARDLIFQYSDLEQVEALKAQIESAQSRRDYQECGKDNAFVYAAMPAIPQDALDGCTLAIEWINEIPKTL